ncbi:hypothetical protein EPYR_00023 [Erwinia pyrifoliae DSM 12163]|nr:hypothetical protein EPYR_00023 [Erwinia pyrifoliae DSM 12163]
MTIISCHYPHKVGFYPLNISHIYVDVLIYIHIALVV